MKGDRESLGVLVRHKGGLLPGGVGHPLSQDRKSSPGLAPPPASVGLYHHGDEGDSLFRALALGVQVLPFELLVPFRGRAGGSGGSGEEVGAQPGGGGEVPSRRNAVAPPWQVDVGGAAIAGVEVRSVVLTVRRALAGSSWW